MVKNYKKKRKTKKIRRKTKRIKRKTQRGVRNHKKLIGGKPKRTYLVIGSLSNDAGNELRDGIIKSMCYENNSFDVSVVFILEKESEFTPKDISNVTKDIRNVTISIIKTDILNYDFTSEKGIEINLKAHKFMITSQPPEDKIEMGTLSRDSDGVAIEELFSTSNSIIIINGFVCKITIPTLISILRDADPDRLAKCYKDDNNLFLECIPQFIPLIIGHKRKIHSIYTQIINASGGGHQQFAKLNLPFYYYFITNLYNTGYTLSEKEEEFVEIYLTELDSYEGENDDGPEDWSKRPEFLQKYQKCLRDIILNL